MINEITYSKQSLAAFNAALSVDMSRPTLRYPIVKGGIYCACDGRRAHAYRVSNRHSDGNLPVMSAPGTLRIGDVPRIDAMILPDGMNVPNVPEVIPADAAAPWRIDRARLQAAANWLGRLKLVKKDRETETANAPRVQLTCDGKVQLTFPQCEGAIVLAQTTPARHEENGAKPVSLNAAYALDALQFMLTNSISPELYVHTGFPDVRANLAPVKITGDAGDVLALVMPVRGDC